MAYVVTVRLMDTHGIGYRAVKELIGTQSALTMGIAAFNIMKSPSSGPSTASNSKETYTVTIAFR